MTERAPDLIAALEAGVPLLTATQRLAREWRRRYDAEQHRRGRTVWESADVLPLGAWVQRQFEEALDAGALGLGAAQAATGGALLSETQAAALWERIVLASPLARDLPRAGGLAARAREAWRRLAEWRLPVPRSEPGAGERQPVEQRAFADWAAAYAAACKRRDWADPAHLPTRVAEALRGGAIAPPPRVLIAGFDDVSPQTQHLLDALRDAGAVVEAVPLPARVHVAVRTEVPDAETEALAAARWARHWLEREPEARIGIVVPDLRERRAQLLRVLEDVLTPAAVLPSAGGAVLPAGGGAPPADAMAGDRPFELSAGLALADYPVVAVALRLLALTPAAQPLETWSALLRSPFLAGAEREADARARLDVRVRAWGAAELSAARLQAVAEERGAPQLAAALGRWRRVREALPRQQAPSAWAVACDGLLRALGWPGERTPDSAEFQTREKWHSVLEELARLDPVLPALSHGEALALLRRLAGETEFQIQGAEARLQVLGVLESGGLDFDHLWVLGLHEDLWPAPPRPNPFLSLELQRRHGMPRASGARELEIAHRETQRLLQSAPDVVIGHPAWDGDRPLRPSPLVRHLPLVPLERLPLAAGATLRAAIGATAALEALRDETAPPVGAGAGSGVGAGAGPLRGGTGIFTDQAACPFRAFAHHRLHARAPESPQPGLDAAERGTLVHGVLERAWRRIRDHASLRALDEPALRALLDEAVEGTLTHFEQGHPHLGPRLRALEHRRLLGLARDWLALERERAPFSVELMEEPQPLEIGGISVSGRVDRIDRLADGTRVLIDYKTGPTRLAAWWGARPDEPQLPLYAASSGVQLAGVAFAQVRRQELTFRGVADDPARFPRAERFDAPRLRRGEPPFASWAAVVEDWRAALEALAQGFRAGDARVDPKHARTCDYCDLPGLCRIAELRGAPTDEDEEAGNG